MAFVLGLCVVGLAGEFYVFRGRVVARAREFDQFGGLLRGQGEVGRGEFDDDFVGRRVGFAEVRGVAEAEGGGGCGWGEGAGEV